MYRESSDPRFVGKKGVLMPLGDRVRHFVDTLLVSLLSYTAAI